MSSLLVAQEERQSEDSDLPVELAERLEQVVTTPGSAEAWDDLEECCRNLDRPDEATALYLRVLKGEGLEIPERRALGARAVLFCNEWYEDTSTAIEVLETMLGFDPEDVETFDQLTLLLTSSGRFDELLNVYDRQIEGARLEAQRAKLLEEAARAARDFAGNLTRGNDYLLELLRLRPSDAGLAAVLERRLAEQARFSDLIELWSLRAHVLSGQARFAALLQVAEHSLEGLADSQKTIAAVDAFVAAGGAVVEARAVFLRVARRTDFDVQARKTSFVRVEEMLAAPEQIRQLIEVLEEHLTLESESDARARHHERLAVLFERTEEVIPALEHAICALTTLPEDLTLRELTFKLAAASGSFHRYAEALEVAAGAAANKELARELLLAAAREMRQRTSDLAAAERIYRRVLVEFKLHTVACHEAATALVALLEATERDVERLEMLVYLADLEESALAKRRAWFAGAELAARLDEPDRALSLLDACLELEPTDIEVLSVRISLLETLGRAEGLAIALEERARARGSQGSEARLDLVRAARVYAEELVKPKSALRLWKEIDVSFGRTDETLDALVHTGLDAGLYSATEPTLVEGIERATSQERRCALLCMLGDLRRVHLQNAEAALSAYQSALALDAGVPAARAGLQSLLELPEVMGAVAEVLAEAFRRQGNFDLLLELVPVRIRSAPSSAQKCAIWQEGGELLRARGDVGPALELWANSFELDPTPQAGLRLVELAEMCDDFRPVARAYRGALQSDHESAELHEQLGFLLGERLGEGVSAAAELRRALELAPTKKSLVQALFRFAFPMGLFQMAMEGFVRYVEATRAIEVDLLSEVEAKLLEHAGFAEAGAILGELVQNSTGLGAELRHDLRKILGIWYQKFLRDEDAAIVVLTRASDDFPRADSLELLAEIERTRGGRPLVRTLLKWVDAGGDTLSLLAEAAQLAREDADPAYFAPVLDRARLAALDVLSASDSTDESKSIAARLLGWTTTELLPICLTDSKGTAIDLLLAAAACPIQERLTFVFHAAELAFMSERLEQTIDLCQRILVDAPDHIDSLLLLSRVYELQKNDEALLSVRAKELAVGRELERRLFLRLELARLYAVLDAEFSQQERMLRENLSETPAHPASLDALGLRLLSWDREQDLLELLEEQATLLAQSEPSRAARLWERAADHGETLEPGGERVRRALRASAQLDPTVSVLDRLAALSRSRDDIQGEVEYLGRRLELTSRDASHVEERRTVVLSLAQAYRRAREDGQARAVLEVELRADPNAEELRALLAAMLEEFEDFLALAVLLVDGAERQEDPEQRVIELGRAALVYRRELSSPASAVPLLERCLEIHPQDRELRLALADSLRELGEFDRAASILEHMLGEYGRRRTAERALVHELLSRVYRAKGDDEQSFTHAEQAASIERTNPAMLLLAGQLARRLGKVEQAGQAYRTLLLLLSRRDPAAASAGAGEAVLLFELHRLAEDEGDEVRARELMQSSIEVAVKDQAQALELSELLAELESEHLLLDALRDSIRGLSSVELAAERWVTISKVLAVQGDFQGALEARMEAIRLCPHNLRLLDATERLGGAWGLADEMERRWVALAESETTSPEVAGELWYRIGQSSLELDPSNALRCFEHALATGHRTKRTFLAVWPLLEALGDRSRKKLALQGFVGSQEALSAPAELADAYYLLASIAAEELDFETLETALTCAIRLELRAEPIVTLLLPLADRAMLSTSLVRSLVVAAERSDSRTQLRALCHGAALEAAEPAWAGRGADLAKELDELAIYQQLLDRSVQLLEAEWDRLRLVSAERELIEAVEVELLARLKERGNLAEEAADFEIAVSLLLRQAELSAEPGRFESSLAAAELTIVRLGDSGAALRLYEALFAVHPEDPRVWRPLIELYRATEQLHQIESCLDALEARELAAGDQLLLRLERARLLIDQGQLADAEEALRECLAVRPNDKEVLIALAQLLEGLERHEELVSFLENGFNQARAEHDAELVEMFALRLGRYLASQEPSEAKSILMASLSFTRESRDVLELLLELFESDDDPTDRTEVLEYYLAILHGAEALEPARALIELREQSFDEDLLGRALDLAFRALGDEAEITAKYLDWLRRNHDDLRLAETLTLLGRGEEQDDRAAAYFTEAGEQYAEIGELALAGRAFRDAFERDSNPEYLGRAVDYLIGVGMNDEALELLDVSIETAELDLLPELLERRAGLRVASGAIGGSELAARDLERALDGLLSEDQALRISESLLSVLEAWRAEAIAVDDSSGARNAARRLTTELIRLERFDQATDILHTQLELEPENLAVATELSDVAERAERPLEAAHAYTVLVRGKPEIAIDVAHRATRFATRSSVVVHELCDLVLFIHQLHPEDDELRQRTVELFSRVGRAEELARAWLTEAANLAPSERRSTLAGQAGEILFQSEQWQDALLAFEISAEMTRDSALAVVRVAECWIAMDDLDRARELLHQAIESHGKRRSPELSLLQHALARVASAAGDQEGLLSWLEAAIFTDRNNVQAAAELAVQAQDLGRYETALKALQMVTLSKSDLEMSKAEAYARQAEIYEAQGDAKKAVLVARRTLSMDSENARALAVLRRVS